MKKLAPLFTFLVSIVTIAQGLVPQMELSDPLTVKIVSGSLLFLVTALTAWKQAATSEIDNSSLWPTIILACIATLGGALDLFNVLPITPATAHVIRFSLTFLMAALNVFSETFYPKAAAIILAVFLLTLPGCFVGNIIKSDCKVTSNVVNANGDSTYDVCLKCKKAILMQAEDSVLIKLQKK